MVSKFFCVLKLDFHLPFIHAISGVCIPKLGLTNIAREKTHVYQRLGKRLIKVCLWPPFVLVDQGSPRGPAHHFVFVVVRTRRPESFRGRARSRPGGHEGQQRVPD